MPYLYYFLFSYNISIPLLSTVTGKLKIPFADTPAEPSEDSISNVFFVLCTTNIDKILQTIQSRSLKINFDLISSANIINNLKDICTQKNIDIDDYVLDLIARRSRGHLRDAHILLDKYILLERESFLKSLQSSEDLYYKLILNAIRKDINMCDKIIQALLNYPLSQLKQDYEQVVLDIIKNSIFKNSNDQYLQLLLKFANSRVFQIVDILNNEEVYKMFYI